MKMSKAVQVSQSEASLVKDYIYVNHSELDRSSTWSRVDIKEGEFLSNGVDLMSGVPLDKEQVQVLNHLKEIISENEKLRKSMAANTALLKVRTFSRQAD